MRSACQGSDRRGEVELGREELGDARPVVAERGERPGRAAELGRQRPRTRKAPLRASTTATSQPAAFSPNVVGTACCSSVRPAIGVSRCVSASRAQAAATPASSSAISASARRATSIAAESTMSWLVAPKWT